MNQFLPLNFVIWVKPKCSKEKNIFTPTKKITLNHFVWKTKNAFKWPVLNYFKPLLMKLIWERKNIGSRFLIEKKKGIGAPSPQTKAITSVVTKAWPTPCHSIASQRGSTSRGSKARQWRAPKRGVAKVADILGEHGVGIDDHARVSWMDISIQQGHQVLCKGRRHWGMEHLGQFRTKCFFFICKILSRLSALL